MCSKYKQIMLVIIFEHYWRGIERIRTAVDGVADHCLATRPRYLVFANLLNLNNYYLLEIIILFTIILCHCKINPNCCK